eukprot:3638794-Rhodomonas_salina.1
MRYLSTAQPSFDQRSKPSFDQRSSRVTRVPCAATTSTAHAATSHVSSTLRYVSTGQRYRTPYATPVPDIAYRSLRAIATTRSASTGQRVTGSYHTPKSNTRNLIPVPDPRLRRSEGSSGSYTAPEPDIAYASLIPQNALSPYRFQYRAPHSTIQLPQYRISLHYALS